MQIRTATQSRSGIDVIVCHPVHAAAVPRPDRLARQEGGDRHRQVLPGNQTSNVLRGGRCHEGSESDDILNYFSIGYPYSSV